MKSIRTTILAAALAPALAFAADPVQTGKSGQDATSKNPQQEAPARTVGKTPAADPTVEGGKSGDGTTLPKAPASKFHGTITAVDKSAMTITVNDQKNGSQVIHVADKTKGVTGSEAASWSELKVGANVHGVIRKETDTLHAESLSIGH